MSGAGPLAGIRVVEFAGIGPAPMCAMLLADLGATVITIDRLTPNLGGIPRAPQFDVCRRNRDSLAIDLKEPEGSACVLDLVDQADAVIEGFRPGTMERLGLGPEVCIERNPKLVFGRVTGWGQTGPLAQAAGHDLNYIAISGALAQIGRAGEAPTIPLNLLGDYGGGGMLLAFGIVSALLEAKRSGQGQVVDAAIAEGAATLMASLYGLAAAGIHGRSRGENLLDGGAPHYNVYACADGEYISIGPIEAKFRAILLKKIGFDPEEFPEVDYPGQWPAAQRLLAARFAERSRDEWCALLEGTDACFAPVLNVGEAPHHRQNLSRGTFVEIAGVVQPSPSPRFSRTPAKLPDPPCPPGAGTDRILRTWGIDEARIDFLQAAGIVAPPGQVE
jgi:alpha-methylacyl-CoA racemase